jgi:type II secretory pathway pseudopilin PulG
LSKKRGETLVEVLVSFGIMSFVMFGLASLISYLITLMVANRTITEATAKAQDGLAKGIAVMDTSCDIRRETTEGTLRPVAMDSIETELNTGVDGLTLDIDVQNILTSEENATVGLTNALGYRKVISTVSWVDKSGSPQQYSIVQVIKR